MRIPAMALAALLAAVLAGCSQSRPPLATRVAPAPAELPQFTRAERVTPIRAGIEGTETRSLHARLVPDFKPIELTPREREAIGEPEVDPRDDILAFYRAPAGPEQGIVPYGTTIRVGAYGHGGGSYGSTLPPTLYGTWTELPISTGVYTPPVSLAGMHPDVRPLYGVGPRAGIRTGVGQVRGVAGRHTSVDQ